MGSLFGDAVGIDFDTALEGKGDEVFTQHIEDENTTIAEK